MVHIKGNVSLVFRWFCHLGVILNIINSHWL
jgi:hypothetical protein